MSSAEERPLPADRIDPHPARLVPGSPGYDEIVARHRAAVAAGELGYLDPRTGLFAQSALALWRRGECCDQGCRHCPYLER